MNIVSKVFQKNYEDLILFQEEIVYYSKESNEWKSEIWKYNKGQDGQIDESELMDEKSYPKGSKHILEEKFPWLKYNQKWKPYKPKLEPYGT